MGPSDKETAPTVSRPSKHRKGLDQKEDALLMASPLTLPPESKPRNTEPPAPAYVLRGLGIFELYGDEILESYRGGGHCPIPSGTEAGKVYEVRIGARAERNRCECRGFASHKHCSHLAAAERAARLSVVCDGCGKRVRRRGAVEVTEDHGSLTWFPGDVVCRPCARGTDIL